MTKVAKKNLPIIDTKATVQLFEFSAMHILSLAVFSRVLLAALAVMISLQDENGNAVSPFVEVRFGDYGFYKSFESENFSLLKSPFIFFYQGGSVDAWLGQSPAPGPIFPWLLNVSDYQPHPIALASVYLITSALLVFGWVLYYRTKKVSLWGQLALITFPLLLWYTLAISTELPMSLALYMFYCNALTIPRSPFRGLVCTLFAFLLMLMIRPNSLSLFPAMLLVIFLNRGFISKWCAVAIVMLSTTLFMYFAVYYAPYFLMVKEASLVITYWELSPLQYSEGIFPNLPLLMNQVISNGALIVSKFIYASGLRPSYSDAPTLFVLLRASSGILILPGIFYCFYRGSWLERVLLLGFLLPLLLTVAQERYLLPIAPLLLLFGGMFWKDLYLRVRAHFCL
ncbi:hypothetical protein OAG94_00845 [bacterium]|nr:hypothetical protein [bacterium]